MKSAIHAKAVAALKNRLQKELNSLRSRQRTAMRNLEAKTDKEDGAGEVEGAGKKATPIFCKFCKLIVNMDREEHNKTDLHLKIQEFLNPYCKPCSTQFFSPLGYEIHSVKAYHVKVRVIIQFFKLFG